MSKLDKQGSAVCAWCKHVAKIDRKGNKVTPDWRKPDDIQCVANARLVHIRNYVTGSTTAQYRIGSPEFCTVKNQNGKCKHYEPSKATAALQRFGFRKS